jgi:mono/diheme cytochrome c family protein
MAKAAFKWLIVANAIIGFAESGWAQDTGPGKAEPKSTTSFGSRWTGDIDVGEREYSSSCAACHGADGKGNGPVTAELKVPPPDLTVLARKNDGVFPFNYVYEIIDGRKTVRVHGTRDMPIWGDRYMPEPSRTIIPRASENLLAYLYDPETIVRMRILAVIDYLNRIQEK